MRPLLPLANPNVLEENSKIVERFPSLEEKPLVRPNLHTGCGYLPRIQWFSNRQLYIPKWPQFYHKFESPGLLSSNPINYYLFLWLLLKRLGSSIVDLKPTNLDKYNTPMHIFNEQHFYILHKQWFVSLHKTCFLCNWSLHLVT